MAEATELMLLLRQHVIFIHNALKEQASKERRFAEQVCDNPELVETFNGYAMISDNLADNIRILYEKEIYNEARNN